MKKLSMTEHKSSVMKAVHKQKKQLMKAVNRVEQLNTPKRRFFRFLHDLMLEVERKWRKK